MRLHRFYIDKKVGEAKEITLPDQEITNQLGKVFRFKSGDQVVIFDGSGFEYVSEITSLTKKEVVLKILSRISKETNNKNVSLYLALIKKGNFELATEKVTEVGVAEIHPFISERSEKKDLNIERLTKIVKEASEQSGRVFLPEVFEVIDLGKAISQARKDNQICIVFDPSGVKCEYSVSTENTAIFIGPEGGFTEKELMLFKENNFQICSLGQNILRAETAAMIGVWSML